MKKFIPNILSIMRMFGAVLLLLTAPLLSSFHIVYILCGITDVADGFLARRMKCGSRLGAILDSIADFMFIASAVIALRYMLVYCVPPFIQITAITEAVIKAAAYIYGSIKFKTSASLHTVLNKITGIMLFLLVFIFQTEAFNVYCIFVCVVSLAAAAEEWAIHIISDKYDPDTKGIFGTVKGKK